MRLFTQPLRVTTTVIRDHIDDPGHLLEVLHAVATCSEITTIPTAMSVVATTEVPMIAATEIDPSLLVLVDVEIRTRLPPTGSITDHHLPEEPREMIILRR